MNKNSNSDNNEIVDNNGNSSKRTIKRVLQIIFITIGVVAIIAEILYLVGVIKFPWLKSSGSAEVQVNQVSVKSSNSKSKENKSNTYSKYVFVGDSRYVGMSEYASDDDVFICKVNMGYDYLIEQMNTIKKNCDKDTALIIGLGVNDIKYSKEKYISKINEMADSMDCKIYYMSVNPVDEKKEKTSGYSVKNSAIDSFNTDLYNGLSDKVTFIDTNKFLVEDGYTTVDGLHYDSETYGRIYNFIKDNL